MERTESGLIDWFFVLKDQYVIFEVTDFCNLNCIMCSHRYVPGPHKSVKGFMKPELFRRILFDLPPRKVPWTIKLFWLGEPLLHPQFDAFLVTALEYIDRVDPNACVDIHTNAVCLGRFEKEILDAGPRLPYLTCSLDALRDETYQKIRQGKARIGEVNRNIVNFLKSRKDRNQKSPQVILQFILMQENFSEAFPFIQCWNELLRTYGNEADRIYIKRKDLHFKEAQAEYDLLFVSFYQKMVENGLQQMPHLRVDALPPEGLQIRPVDVQHPCSAPWKTPVINFNGDLTICCFDSFFDFELGSLKNHRFSDLWFSEKMKKLRRMIYFHDYDRIIFKHGKKRCSGCIHVPWPKWSGEELNILRQGLDE